MKNREKLKNNQDIIFVKSFKKIDSLLHELKQNDPKSKALFLLINMLHKIFMDSDEKFEPGMKNLMKKTGSGNKRIARALDVMLKYNMIQSLGQDTIGRDLYVLIHPNEWLFEDLQYRSAKLRIVKKAQ